MKSTANIEQLIPHRYPFLFVDEITSATQEEIIGITTFNHNNVLLKGSNPETGIVPGTVILESMAQCGGAGVRLLGITNGIFALAHIESVQFFDVGKYGEKVRYEISNLRMSEKIIKHSGKAFFGDTLLMEASWMSIRIDRGSNK